MNTRDIHFFLKVYECESISLAAEQLFITPQGLSNIITKLEKELGEELFIRSRMGTYPTEYGKAFKLHAEKMMDHYEDALREMKQIRSESDGTIRLGYAFGALSRLATDAPLKFQELNQDYSLQFMELPDKTIEEFVEKGELDIGFTCSMNPNKFDATLMYERRIMFVAHDQSRFYDWDSVSVADICEEPLTLRNDQFATTAIMMREFDKHGVRPSMLMRTGGIVRSMIFCSEHKANTVILESLENDFTYDNVRVIPFREDLTWCLYMITKKGRPLSRAAWDYINYIHQQ